MAIEDKDKHIDISFGSSEPEHSIEEMCCVCILPNELAWGIGTHDPIYWTETLFGEMFENSKRPKR